MRLAADENFNGRVLKQLQEHWPDLDIVRVQDTEMYQQPDPMVLEWAAREQRIVLTHDVQTLVGDAYTRIKNGLPMPGVICVSDRTPIGRVLEDLEYIILAAEPTDFVDRIIFVPLH